MGVGYTVSLQFNCGPLVLKLLRLIVVSECTGESWA